MGEALRCIHHSTWFNSFPMQQKPTSTPYFTFVSLSFTTQKTGDLITCHSMFVVMVNKATSKERACVIVVMDDLPAGRDKNDSRFHGWLFLFI